MSNLTRVVLLCVMSLSLTAITVLTTGCAGIGVRAETYRIDEKFETQNTYKSETKGFKCWFVNCADKQIQGS